MDNKKFINLYSGKTFFTDKQNKTGIYHKRVHTDDVVSKFGDKRGKYNHLTFGSWAINLEVFSEILPSKEIHTLVFYHVEADKSYVISYEKAADEHAEDALGRYEPQAFIPRSAFEILDGKV